MVPLAGDDGNATLLVSATSASDCASGVSLTPGAGSAPGVEGASDVDDAEALETAVVVEEGSFVDDASDLETTSVAEGAPDGVDPAQGSRVRPLPSGLRVCVVGGGRAGEGFARALAGRLARLPGARLAVLCAAPVDGGGAPARSPGPPSPPAPVARRTARALVADGRAASVHGRVVEAGLPDVAAAAAEALAHVHARAPGAPVLTVLPGVRSRALDPVVGEQDVVLVVVGDDAPPSLAALAVAELGRLAPGAVVQAVPLPGRIGAAAARRAAVGRVLEALR